MYTYLEKIHTHTCTLPNGHMIIKIKSESTPATVAPHRHYKCVLTTIFQNFFYGPYIIYLLLTFVRLANLSLCLVRICRLQGAHKNNKKKAGKQAINNLHMYVVRVQVRTREYPPTHTQTHAYILHANVCIFIEFRASKAI